MRLRYDGGCIGLRRHGSGKGGTALWLLAQGWTAAAVARALERDAHTIGQWAEAFSEGGPRALAFEQSGGSPPR